jgi:cyclo(L-tyrosyl-L-tyrosyl) synthase
MISGDHSGDLLFRPFTKNSADISRRGRHLVLVVSPNNGYFTEERIRKSIDWAWSRFSRVEVCTVSTEMVAATFLARGYGDKQALTRARKHMSQIRNRVKRAITTSVADPDRVRVWYMNDETSSPAYWAARERVVRARQQNAEFGAMYERTVRDVLVNRMPEGWEPTAEQIEIGMQYLDTEIPYYMDIPGIVGVEELVLTYRDVSPFVPFLYSPESDIPVSPRQGFAVLATQDADH